MKIIELSTVLANQIAAGEVVERPASVVKELIENAVDANSTEITIKVEEAGLKLIQVIDNGNGIENEDVLMAFKRHATSKIRTQEDLFRIRTLGFRGEALPSIASVSHVTMETAVAGEAGTIIEIEGGQVIGQHRSKARQGTNITIKNIFYNTPARLKYVKSIQTELGNITNVVSRAALGRTDIRFELIHDGKLILNTLGNSDLAQTIAGIYGRQIATQMVPFESESLDFAISGYTSLPNLTRSNRHYISVFINNRYIKNFVINQAIEKGYGSKLMIGRNPITVLNIELDPILVDVNVHPTKQEVRLSKEQKLYDQIMMAINQALSSRNLIPSGIDSFKQARVTNQPTVIQESIFDNRAESQTPSLKQQVQDAAVPNLPMNGEAPQQIAYSYQDNQIEDQALVQEQPFTEPDFSVSAVDADHDENPLKTAAKQLQTNDTNQSNHFPELDYIGQYFDTYILAQDHHNLYLVDQHAAQERIKYEYYREEIGRVSNQSQQVLLPILFEFTVPQAAIIAQNSEELQNLGIELSFFGQNTYQVVAHPTWIDEGVLESTLWEMFEMLFEEGQISIVKLREATAIMMSCKRSIKANHRLSDEASRQLLNDLARTRNPYNCPHGRPVLIRFSNKEIEKMFKRIQDSKSRVVSD